MVVVGRTYLYSAGDDLMIKAWNLPDLTLHASVDVSMSFLLLFKITFTIVSEAVVDLYSE